eukprot:364737-Chlamydomonas_euryale.AAC.9
MLRPQHAALAGIPSLAWGPGGMAFSGAPETAVPPRGDHAWTRDGAVGLRQTLTISSLRLLVWEAERHARASWQRKRVATRARGVHHARGRKRLGRGRGTRC